MAATIGFVVCRLTRWKTLETRSIAAERALCAAAAVGTGIIEIAAADTLFRMRAATKVRINSGLTFGDAVLAYALMADVSIGAASAVGA